MKLAKYLIMPILAMVMFCVGGCSDDAPEPKSDYALLGIYSKGTDEFMEIEDLDWIYQYNLEEYAGEKYWIKRKLTYLYEPVSELLLRQDIEGLLQVDKVISVDSQEMTLCWVATPLTEEVDEDSKFEIIQVFFKDDYKVDPANYRTYKRITANQLKAGLGNIEVIEAY
ncbi:MAG: hypothetical protein K2J78_02995 [Muribaculaceae bacterium]|nr:hypothetical protein [Muribaculaceae bacterium]